MGKVVDLMARMTPVRWYIDIAEGECLRCRYVDENESYITHQAHWRVVVEAATIDRLCVLLKEAEKQLAKEMAVMRTSQRYGRKVENENE